MKAIRAAAHELTDQLQAFIGHVEGDENEKAVAVAKKIFITMQLLITGLASKIAEADVSFAIVERQLAEVAQQLKRGGKS